MTLPAPQDEIVDKLSHRSPLPPLLPTAAFDPALRTEIDSLPAPALVRAVLHLMNDDLAHSHPIVQKLEGDPSADYCHAIIHRREGDFSNSKYWIRRAAGHPLLAELWGNPTKAAVFVDEIQMSGGVGDELKDRQYDEMKRLLEYCRSREEG